MANNNFLEGLKVPDTNKSNMIREVSYADKDVYTCLKLMRDTNKVQTFLAAAREQGAQDQEISTDKSENYYYSISHQLAEAEFNFRKGKIDGIDFNSKINQVCKSYDLDFEYLMDITDKIDSLEKEPNEKESVKLAQAIEARAIEEREKRMNQEKENKD